MRAVFDTNAVISALVYCRRLSWFRRAWASGAVTPVVCRETTIALLRVLLYPKFRLNETEREILLAEYLPFAETAVLPESLPVLPVACWDRDDAVFRHLAVASRAELRDPAKTRKHPNRSATLLGPGWRRLMKRKID